MSWPMPDAGQWNAGMSMTPDMNMGSYSAEQWAMQQHNWQQWSQWQAQYAQWQNQYGDTYVQQMQSMPPLPPTSAPPPPAEKPPPPPPPHENNQPLYGNAIENNQPPYGKADKPAPVPAPPSRASNPVNVPSVSAGNKQWSNVAETSPAQPSSNPASQLAHNAEALDKLTQEQKLFDIQFQKWEEQIVKWKKENANHPDKQAYIEYDQRFDACRAQLLERRQQMQLTRARLTQSNPAQPTGNTTAPPLIQKTSDSNYRQNNNTTAPPLIQKTPNSNYRQNNTSAPPLIQKTPNSNYRQNITSNNNYGQNQMPNNNYRQNQTSNNSYGQNQNYNKQQDQNYSNQNNQSYQQYNKPAPGYNEGTAPQDRFESYHDMEEYSSNDNHQTDNSSFLPTSGASKSIPGLDLVPETEKPSNSKQDVIDITEDPPEQYPHQRHGQPQGPDYTTISKGINNILGDEKIMNILSMVRDQGAPPPGNMGNGGQNYSLPPPKSAAYNNQNAPSNNQWDRNDNYNQQYQQYGDRQNNMPMNRQEPRYPMQNNQGQNRYPSQNQKRYDEMQDNMQDQYYDENSQQGSHNMPSRYDDPPSMIPRPNQNAPAPRPLMELPNQLNNFPNRGPPNRGQPNIGMPPENVRPPNPPPRPKWTEEPLFTPSFIVEYEHKPLRLKARDFIEPVHTFDYNHISKDGESKKKDFEKEADDLFMRKPRRERDEYMEPERYARDQYSKDFERRVARDTRDDIRDEYRHRPPRLEYDDRRRPEERHDDRRRDDRDRNIRREDSYRDRERERDREKDRDREREKDKDLYRDRFRDVGGRRDDSRRKSKSRERDTRKREHSKELEEVEVKKSKADKPKHVVMIDDILEEPGRSMRPEKIVIILRGPPGSGKSYLAKLIRDKEAEYGGTARIMSIDDYFMQEGEVEERDPATGKMIKKPTLKYEYDEALEETYLTSLKRAFKRTLTDGYFTFLIYDAVNETLRSYGDVWNFARQNGFQVYVCTMDLDAQTCFKRNIHNRSLLDVQVISTRFFPTPTHHIALDATTLLQGAAITHVLMEDAEDEVLMEDAQEPEVESVFTSKWEKMDDAAQLARLDGINKPLRPSQLSMEDYLQLDDWKPNTARPGKKTVRWADIEERREQEKMRAIGFVVGQTDWNRMTDPTMGSSALTQTKYIERIKKK